MRIVLVGLEKNDVDIFAQRLNGESFKRHSDMIGLWSWMALSNHKMQNRKGVGRYGILPL